MRIRIIAVAVIGVLVLGSIAGFAYARSKGDGTGVTTKDFYKDMIKIMKKNGYENMAEAMKKNDYEAMDEFMNNLTDEDYNRMIEIMRDNGYETMARMMESIEREEMIEMHNAMGGAQSCHAGYYNMMGGY
jgi:hypothetical protein